MNGWKVRVVSLFVIASATVASAQDVQYEKYKLDNGMTVILHEDHSLPVGGINLWYRVGAKDEPIHRSGFAHLFEHLMFMGTQRVPGNKFDTIMEAGGGSNNASTSSDRTNYFSNGPKELLPTLLWLDADRLEDLARMMDKEKLDKQRAVVLNERRQSYENRPYGKADLKIQELLYPPGHPYHIPVIGTHEDLEAATVGDVKDFFATYYVPNNLSLVVAGDFDSSAIKQVVNKLFGSIPRGGEPPHRTAEPVRLHGVKRATVVDKVQLAKITMSYHSPPIYKPGDAEMDLIAAILTDGKTSRLYKRLVYDDKLATQVWAYQGSGMLDSEFRIAALVLPGKDLDAVENAIDEEVARLIAEGPTTQELVRHKASMELSMLRQLQSVPAKADRLNAYEMYLGEPNSFRWDLDRYRNATTQGIRKWAASVLKPDARVIVRVLPVSPPHIASARDEQPGPAIAGPFSPQLPEKFTLSNGIHVMLWQKSELPLVAMNVVFHEDGYLGSVERAGSVDLMANMLDEGAGNFNALEFGDAMQALGAQFATRGGRESVNISLTVLKRNFEKAPALAVDTIRKPRFDQKEWDRVKRLHLDRLKQQDDQPTVVAARVASSALFGKDHPYGVPSSGTKETVEPLTLDQIRSEASDIIRPENATILLAGDLSAGEARNLFENLLGNWNPNGKRRAKTTGEHPFPLQNPMRVFVVDRPDAVQTVIRFLMPGPKFTNKKRVSYELLNTILGGSFTSRLNLNLREQHGYTYGARSSFVMMPRLGYVVASSSVRADVTGKSVKEFLHEINRTRNGDISPEETRKARETVRTNTIESFAGLRGVLAEARRRLLAGVPFSSLGDDMEAIQNVGASELNGLAKSAIPMENAVLILVGDKRTILDQIQGLVPTPVELDIHGNRVGS